MISSLSLREGWDFTKGFGNGIWDRVADTASSTASLLKTSSDYSAPQLISDYYRDSPSYESKILNAQDFIQGLGLYFQESSKDFNSAGTALTDLFVPGCREIQNLSNEASYYDKGRAWGHGVTDLALLACAAKCLSLLNKCSALGQASKMSCHFASQSSSGLSILGKEGLPSIDALSKAGQMMDRKGLTRAGRALDKHGNRPNALFPKATGDVASKNTQGQKLLEEILNHPQSKLIKDGNRGYEIYSPNGRGAYFGKDGYFRGFIEER